MDIEKLGLEPHRIYTAIQNGVKDAILEALRSTYSNDMSGDRITKALAKGVQDGFTEAVRSSYSMKAAGDRITDAIAQGTEKAIKP